MTPWKTRLSMIREGEGERERGGRGRKEEQSRTKH